MSARPPCRRQYAAPLAPPPGTRSRRRSKAVNRRPPPRHWKFGSPDRPGPLRTTWEAEQREHGGGASCIRSGYERAGVRATTGGSIGTGVRSHASSTTDKPVEAVWFLLPILLHAARRAQVF